MEAIKHTIGHIQSTRLLYLFQIRFSFTTGRCPCLRSFLFRNNEICKLRFLWIACCCFLLYTFVLDFVEIKQWSLATKRENEFCANLQEKATADNYHFAWHGNIACKNSIAIIPFCIYMFWRHSLWMIYIFSF